MLLNERLNEILNENQLEAIHHLNGPLMVLAGPGSGKTTVITYRALQLIKEGAVPPKQVLVITFSKAAATEMETRFSTLNNGELCVFGTFHAIFFRILRKRYGYSVDQILQESTRRDMIIKILSKSGTEADEDMLTSIRNEISLVKNELHDLPYYNSSSMGADEFRQLFSQYEEAKKAQNKIDFDDMLTLCHSLWQNEPDNLAHYKKQFSHIMIDEFQDINRVQYECMRMLSSYNLCVVGDDDQSIYRFRGASPEFLLRFPKDYPDVKKVLLDINYRSSDPIITFSNKIIAKNQMRYEKVIIGTQKKGNAPKIINNKDQNNEADYIAAQIKKHPNYNEVAVIYRINMQARAFMDAFMQANIPYVVKDEASIIYEHWIAQDIFAYLRLSCGLGSDEDAEHIVNKPFRYISKAFLQKARQEGRDIFEWYTHSGMLNLGQQQRIEELAMHINAMGKRSPADAIKLLRSKTGYDEHIKDHCDYRKINASGLYEIIAEIQEAALPHKDHESFLAHAQEAIENKNIKDPDGERVTLTTLHSAKGLEFDTVYIAGAVEGLLPYERSKTDIEIEEERRLFYVGATRARQNLFISVIKTRHERDVEPSRFIKS